MPQTGLVGRAAELDNVRSFFDAAERSSVVMVIEGEAGIGKTTLWEEAIRLGRARGITVLLTRATEAETGLSFAGLADLLEPLGEEIFTALPVPQRDALAAALLKTAAPPGGVDERALAASVLSVLRSLSTDRGVLVAVDDAQWLDPASSRALAFAVRRLHDEPVGFLLTARTGGGRRDRFDDLAPAEAKMTLSLSPLTVADLYELVTRRAGGTLSRPVTMRIAQSCAGNPLYALEIAAAVSRQPVQGPLPVPPSLEQLLEERVGGLPERTRDALLVSAMLSRPTPELVDLGALEPAEEAGVVVVEGGRIRFGHPLLAAAVYDRASPSHRRRVHADLAARVSDPEERARHLAAITFAPEERIAAELHDAASLATARGAAHAAAELLEMAIRLTPPGEALVVARRQVEAARRWFDAGDLARSQELLEVAIANGDTALRCQALSTLAQVHFRRSSFAEAMSAASQARRDATDVAMQVRLELDLAFFSLSLADFPGTELHARRAVGTLPADADPGLQAEVLAVSTICDFLCGRGLDDQRLERSLVLEDWDSVQFWQMRPSFIASCLFLYTGRPDRAVELLGLLHTHAVDRGQEAFIPLHCMYLAWAQIWLGDLAAARDVAELARQAASLVGDPASGGAALTARALVHAHDGQLEAARLEATEAIQIFTALDWPAGVIFPAWALGLAHAAAGSPGAVDAVLGPLAGMLMAAGEVDPAMAVFLPEEIEALIDLGELDRASALLAWYDRRAQRPGRPLARALSARCRALLLAARGDPRAALAAVEEAVGDLEGLAMPFERARTLLVRGRLLRRTGRRAQAREVLDEAVSCFDRIGSPIWSGRARSELERLGSKRVPPGRLTATEATIAALAASGISNREIADRAFLTVKAVEANLTRVYRKLGIRSRAGLARALDTPTTDQDPAMEGFSL